MEERAKPPIYLEYGDIIKIYAPSNIELHQHSFFIKYIDSTSKISLLNTSTLYPYTLYYNEDDPTKLRDESIEHIEIIWKSPLKGYIAQNGLSIHNWIDIYFGGDFPVIFTGEITEIQDDQMEITLYPSLEVIYIDFEYKGLPEDKPIEKIVLRQKPKYIGTDLKSNPVETEDENANEDEEDEEESKQTEINESILLIPDDYEVDPNIKDKLHNLYIDANDIVFDLDDIEIVNQIVELDSKNKIYSLEEQVTNLLDELLSTIPNNSRTKSVMDNIQRIIVHFKRLRTEFSKMDKNGNIESPLILGANYKPLVNKIHSLSANLRWIIPVVSVNKTLYAEKSAEDDNEPTSAGVGEENIDQQNSLQFTILNDNLKELNTVQNNYFKNINGDGGMSKYSRLIKSTEKLSLPYSNIESVAGVADIIEHKQVEADIEAIIDNLQEFKTIVYVKTTVNLQKYVIQKYNLGTSMNWIEGKKHAKTTQLTPNETINIKSLLMMPEEIVRFSKIDLPNTSILTRSVYSHNYPMSYKIFNSKLEDNLERISVSVGQDPPRKKQPDTDEFNHEKREIETNIPFLSNFKDFTIDKVGEVVDNVNTTGDYEAKRYERFLQKIVPNTYDLITLIQRYLPKTELNGFSLLEILSLLEPFAVYPSNITYNSYIRIRYFIKQAIVNWKTQQSEHQKEYRLIREKKWETGENDIQQPFFELFKENTGLQNQYYTSYKTAFEKFIRRGVGQPEGGARGANMIFYDELGDTIFPPQTTGLKTSQVLNTILNTDCGKTATTALRIILASLTIPDKLIDSVLNDMNELTPDEMEKVKPGDCSRRFLTKIYKSLRDLQNDNHKEIFYDKELDKTAYDLLTKDLKTKKEKMPAPEFLDYFAETLVQKSGIPRNISLEMANNIIRGKKQVMEGEYAILETYPTISVKSRQLEEEGGKNEEEIVEKHDIVKTYYIRTKNVWKRDDTVDGNAFIDNNTLLCNLTEPNHCVKRTKTDICQETEEARREILAKTRASLFKEFDERVDESFASLKESLEKQLKSNIARSKKIQRMEEIQLFKENKYAFDLGEIDKHTIGAGQHSRWEVLLEKILSQPDFVKKQNDILTFADRFTREPMVENLNESSYWFYCCETNLKLLPIYIYELAKAFVVGGSDEYALKLKEVVRKYGTLSEDGDSIVDGIGGSGRVIQKIDFVEEELFNDAGFKIQTKTAIDKDIDVIVNNALGTSPPVIGKSTTANVKPPRVFENETNETIYNVLTTICRNIGISPDGIEDDVIRISSETVSVVVVNEKKYIEKMKKVEKPKPYIQYRNQNIILIVAFVTLVAVQSAVPPFQPENTVPGCVLSFAGFPLEGGEDGNTDGLRYLACVLNISKSSIGVWSAIQSIKNPVQTFIDAMIKSISKHVIQREDVLTMFLKKREFLILNPGIGIGGEGKIPKSHTIQKWTTFLPPLIHYKIADKLTGSPLSDNFFQGFKRSLTKGETIQWQELGIVKTKIIEYTFAIIEYINNIVKKSNPLLNTVNSVPFLQNSCCNELSSTQVGGNEKEPNQTVLGYFANKETDINRYIEIVSRLTTSIGLNDALSLANIFVHTVETARKSTTIPVSGHSIENIYQSFIHYCKFDNETAPIPDYLKPLVSSKPTPDYHPTWSILEKIKYLKENGKNYAISDIDRLLRLVNARNVVESTNVSTTVPVPVQVPNVEAIVEYINYLDDAKTVTGVIEDPLKKHLRAVLTSYHPTTMIHTDSEELGALKNYLIYSNSKMTESIYNFFDEYRGSIDLRRIEDAKMFIHDFAVWEDDTDEKMATMVRFTKNVIYDLSVVFPTMIRENKPIFKTVPIHWDLSLLHRRDVDKFIESYYVPLLKFMGDNSISELLYQIMESLKVLIGFITHIPVINPLRKAGVDEKGAIKEYAFYSVFDKDAIYLLFKYLFNSVLYEYLQKSNDPDVVKMDAVNIRNKKRESIKRNRDLTEETKGADVDNKMVGEIAEDENERLHEIQLRVGELENIKKKTVEMMVSFLSIEKETKTAINKSYKTVSERVIRTRLDEKKTITDYFKNMLDDERKVEYTLKKMKMGRWNLGMQKGVFEYDKGIYDKEHNDIVGLLTGEGGGTGALNDYVIQPMEKTADVNDLEINEKQLADDEYEKEEWDIRNLGEDYMDGNYYGEDDADRDFGED